MTAIATKLAAIACTLVVSATMVLGAVAPAQVSTADASISRQVA